MNGFRVLGLTPGRLMLLLAALALVIFAGIASVLSFKKVAHSDDWLRHSWRVKNAAADFMTHVVDAETGQRGFLLTGRTTYLGPYMGAGSAARADLDQLLNLTADDPSQQERAKKLRALTEAKFAELKQTLDLAQQKARQEALDLVNSDVGKTEMEEIRALTTALKDEEDHLLEQRLTSVAAARKSLLGFILIGLTSAIFFVGFCLWNIMRLVRRLHEDAATLDREIKRREEIEAALVHAQKIEAVGQLTGGIAHDFNNLLTVILGNLDTAQRRIKAVTSSRQDDSQLASMLQRPLEAAMAAGRSGAQLVRQLLTFARQQALTPAQLDLNRLTSAMTDMIRRTLGETVDVQTILAGGLWPTFADSVQIETALLNLVVNARDAMPEGGNLTIETANAYLDDDYASRFGDVVAGQYVLLSVTDSGAGIAPDVLQHVFEPFFTTKGVGNGTGLGLAMVHGLVKQSRGHIRIYSELGKGTTVKIYLPRMQSASPVPSTPTSPSSSNAIVPRARPAETVLLVEDNEDVRVYAATILQDLGYRVLVAGDVPAALKMLDLEGAEKIDIVFTDVVLPLGMSGAVLATEIERRRADLPILFTTGYTRNAIVHNGVLDTDAHLINKPYTLLELGRKIRELLDGAAAAADCPTKSA